MTYGDYPPCPSGECRDFGCVLPASECPFGVSSEVQPLLNLAGQLPPCSEALEVSDDGGGELKDHPGHASPSPAIDTEVPASGQRARQVAHGGQ